VDELVGGGGGAPENDSRVNVTRTRETNNSEAEGCRGGGQMPGRRTDAVVAAAS
jgi:hypothetical protein